MNPVSVVFMGSPAFAVPSLRALVDAGYEVRGVVTQPDRPAGRGGRVTQSEVKRTALELGLPVLQPETFKADLAVEHLRALEPDLIVVAAYGKILPRRVLDIPGRGCINVHASLLPRWRGASPVAAAILNGDAETGVTIMEMVLEMDAGPIVSQAALPIEGDDTTGSLERSLSVLGGQAAVAALPGWLDGSLPARPQDEAQATYCRTLRKEDGWLGGSMTAVEAARAVRAYSPWPGAYVVYRGERLGIRAAHVAGDLEQEPGTLRVESRKPAVAFHAGWLIVDEVQRPGRRAMSGDAFVNGERGALPATVELA